METFCETVTHATLPKFRGADCPACKKPIELGDVVTRECFRVEIWHAACYATRPATVNAAALEPVTSAGKDAMSQHLEQPMPTANNEPAVWDLVMADFKNRDRIGVARYHVRLQPFNGRDYCRDAYEELLDGAVYIRGLMYERQHQMAAGRALYSALAALVSEIRAYQSPECDDDGAPGALELKAADEALSRAVPHFAITVEGEKPPAHYDLVAHLERQRKFSLETFGPGARQAGVLAHIRKECAEVETAGRHARLEEWIDLVLLALDGAWRSGHEPAAIVAALAAKQAKNERRDWPDWRTASPDAPIEHVRGPAHDHDDRP